MNQDKFTEQELLEARERNKKSRKFKNDTVWESNEYGSYTVIGRFDDRKLYIRFLNKI